MRLPKRLVSIIMILILGGLTMAAGHVDRVVLESNYQNPGEDYDNEMTEGAFEVVAQQVDDNWDDYKAVKDSLNSTASGASGAHYVKSAPISGVTGGNVYAQIADIFTQLQAASMGVVPNGSITDAKLSADANQILARFAQRSKQVFADSSRATFHQYLVDINTAKGKVTFVGDSITSQGWYFPLQTLFPDITYVNKGVGGDTSGEVVNRLTDIKSSNADLYVIAIGSNDVRYQDPAQFSAMNPTEFVANITTIVNTLQTGNKKFVIIHPFPSFDGDTISVFDYFERDRTIDAYGVAERLYCADNGIPFINPTPEIRDVINFKNRLDFLIDDIHPNVTLGHRLYSNAILFGNQQEVEYQLPYESTAKYFYKLEILDAFADGQTVSVNDLQISPNPVEYYVSNFKGTYTTVSPRQVKMMHEHYPCVILFSTDAPLEYVKQVPSADPNAIRKWNLYVSNDKSAVYRLRDESWLRVAGEDDSGAVKKTLYLRGGTVPITLNSNWSYRGSSIVTHKNGLVTMQITVKKSSAWVNSDIIGTFPTLYAPQVNAYVTALSTKDSSSGSTTAPVIVDTNGNISFWSKATNASADDCISFTVSYSIN